MTNATGQNVRHHLMSGILGDHQEFLVPISALAAGSGFAFQLELFLNDDAKVVGSTNTSGASYSLEEVSYDMELVEVSDAIQADINSELAAGSQIPSRTSLGGPSTPPSPVREPSTRWTSPSRLLTPRRLFRHRAPILDQKQSVTAAKYLGTDYDPYTFSGGRKRSRLRRVYLAGDFVTKYNWRYGSTVLYPSAPIELNQDSTVALETTLRDLRPEGQRPSIPSASGDGRDGFGSSLRVSRLHSRPQFQQDA